MVIYWVSDKWELSDLHNGFQQVQYNEVSLCG